jgi:hypothetical protein
MIEPFLRSQMEPVIRRYRRLLRQRGLRICWGAGASRIRISSSVILTGWSSAFTFRFWGSRLERQPF